jgi:hypothetical protein
MNRMTSELPYKAPISSTSSSMDIGRRVSPPAADAPTDTGNRGGDRGANNALYVVVLGRLRYDPRTRAYAERRTHEGLSRPEIIRCLKRYVAREIFTPYPRWPPKTIRRTHLPDHRSIDPLSDVEARAGNAHRIVWARCGNAGSVSEPAFRLIENRPQNWIGSCPRGHAVAIDQEEKDRGAL